MARSFFFPKYGIQTAAVLGLVREGTLSAALGHKASKGNRQRDGQGKGGAQPGTTEGASNVPYEAKGKGHLIPREK